MENFQEKVRNELKKIVNEDIPKNLNDEQRLKLKKIEEELNKNAN